MAMDTQTIKELSASGLDNVVPLCIQYRKAATGKTDKFELKSSLLHHIPKYHGLSMEDPNKHLNEFEVVCSSMTPINVDGNILKMKAFPFSLLEKAKDWLYELAPEIVTSWESMKRAFLEKFFPTSRMILLRTKISGIQQNQGESFPAYYERFKALVASYPQHQMKEELLIQLFYEGLLPIERQMLDASAGGALVDKTPMAVKILIANQALNAQQYEGVEQRDIPQQQHVNEVSTISEIQSQLANLTLLVSQVVERPKVQENSICGVCSIQGHQSEKCPQLIENRGWESANAIGFQGQNQQRNDPYSNTYNLGWRDHPKFRFMQLNKEESEKDIMETFRKVQLNIHLLDAIKQVPRFERAMLDLGASINVMPYSIYVSMNLGELKHDGVIIQLADHSNAYPKGVLEDVLVQVNHLVFPADFYVLEMEDSAHATPLPILLGRPFMKTARTKIDVFKGTLSMEFDREVIDFNISEAMRYPNDDHSCFSIDIIDLLAQEHLEQLHKDALEMVITNGVGLKNEGTKSKHTHGMHETTHVVHPSEEVIEMVVALESLPPQYGKLLIQISNSVSTNKMLPSVIQAPSLKLKPLPSHLKYVFLDDQETLPVIVFSLLTAQEEGKLVRMLKEYKTAIGWTLADIKGISPTTCMHRILLEEWAKPSRGHLNPPRMEVVKKEIIKLLDCYNQIVITPDDQEKTTFTCPFGTFAYRRMPFGLCNAPTTFQRCMMSIFSDYVEKIIEVFMDDFSVFGDSFDECLSNLTLILKCYIETNIVLNWEKCHFMSKQALKYLLTKKEAKPRLIRWIHLLQEFDIEIRDKKGSENVMADHLSRLVHNEESLPIPKPFPDEQLLSIEVIDYVSKWVETKATRINDSRVVADFIKTNIFSRFGMPRVIISDGGSHFCNRTIAALFKKYNVKHKVVKTFNLDLDAARIHRKLQLNELEEIRNEAYENACIYKEKTKAFHDKMICSKTFSIGQKVLLFNSHLRLFPVQIQSLRDAREFKVNRHRLKPYYENVVGQVVEEIHLHVVGSNEA
ncbi:unnamed protein product [Malus baccata var. baccata]